MIKRLVPALMALLACGCSLADPATPDPRTRAHGEDKFDRDSRAEYTVYGVMEHWAVERGALTGFGPAHHEVLIRTGPAFADGWVETSTKQADDGGLVLRFADNGNYYLLGFRDDDAPEPRGERNLQIYRNVNGTFMEVATADVVWPRGTQHTVRFEAQGPVLRAYLDGRLQASWTDLSPPLPAGGFGVRHYGADDAWTTRFDLFRWREVPR
ncbi:hypothetical protein [Longimicrobium sp.]|uniref:hypothetical protein n=1 Tax=Longimicrobium sp. TaxID=2029185 RepID=UPI002EDB908E